jgi:hypothetical protein
MSAQVGRTSEPRPPFAVKTAHPNRLSAANLAKIAAERHVEGCIVAPPGGSLCCLIP